MFELYAHKSLLAIREREPLVSGAVDMVQARFGFSEEWEGLSRTVVFQAEGRSWELCLDDDCTCHIPWEALSEHDRELSVGVYGTLDGRRVLPTVWAKLGTIREGASPGEAARPPTPDLWEQELAKKQDKLTGEPGQIVGFDEDGNAAAQENTGGGQGPSGAGGSPIGTVISFMGTVAPEGYLACDGGEYAISAYPRLAGFIKEQFDSFEYFGGDGETTFAVPDLRNLFLRGYHGEAEKKLSGEIGEKQEGTIFPNMGVGTGNNWNGITPGGIAVYPTNADEDLEISDLPLYYHDGARYWNTERRALRFTSHPVNASVLYCIKAFEPNNRGDEYSAEEIRVGTWVDGKPLYRRVFETKLPNTTEVNQLIVPFDAANINCKRFDVYGTYKGDVTTRHLIQTHSIPVYWDGYYKVCVAITINGITASCGSTWFNDPITIILEYTKTTD